MSKLNKTPKILIIEDSEIAREVSAEILRTQGYEVIEAIDGMSGLVAVQGEQPDLVVLDLHLPDITGVELAGLLQHKMAFIAFTVDGTQAAVQACIDRGALGYVLKPLKAEDFLRQIQLALTQGRERLNLRRVAQETQTINKALGILMGYHRLAEEVAYQALVSKAMAQRIKVAELAEQVIEAFRCSGLLQEAGVRTRPLSLDPARARALLKGFTPRR